MVFDEIQVMAYGLARAGGLRGLAFETPLAVSNGVTPLWFWLQAAPARLFGETSALGLRALPVLLGLVGIGLAVRVGRRLATARGAWLAGALYALLGPLVYVNVRGEFTESLLAPLALLTLADLLPERGRPVPWRAALWPSLALLTHLGKGLLLWGAYGVALALLAALARRRGTPGRLPLGRGAALLFFPLLPAGLWLATAELTLFSPGRILMTDVGPVSSVGALVTSLTLGYGTVVKGAMVGSLADALSLYRDARVWPTAVVLALPLVAAVGRNAALASVAWRRGEQEEMERRLLPLALGLPPLVAVVAKGTLDARFHLLTLAVLLPPLADALDVWLAWSVAAPARFLGAGALVATYLELASPAAGKLALILIAGVALVTILARRTPRRGESVAAAALVLGLGALLLTGPLDWGRRLAWEPGPGDPAPRPASAFPNPDLQLARCFRDRDGLDAARPFLRRALDRNPDDRGTLLEAGSALLDAPPDARAVAASAAGYLRRRPGDRTVERLLRRALARGGSPPAGQNQAGEQVPR